jgi:hypothetical protein
MKHPVRLTILKGVKGKATVVTMMTMKHPVQLIMMNQIKKRENTRLIHALPGDLKM